MNTTLKRIYREWLKPLLLVVIITSPLRSSVIDWNWVPTGSMKPTIVEGDLVLVNKLAYDLKVPFTTHHLAQWADPARGDIVVCFSPHDGTRLVKRVVGLPGDTLELRHGVLVINGTVQPATSRDAAPYARDIFEDAHPQVAVERLGATPHLVMALPSRSAGRDFAPYRLPEGNYFLMGDSRDNSFDSRFFGPVARDQILGRAHHVIASFDTARYLLPRLGRFAQSLDSDER